MQDYKHNNSATEYIKKRNRQRAIFCLVGILIVITGISTIRLVRKRAYVHTMHANLEREYSTLIETQKKINTSLKSFENQEGIDRVIRNTYRAVKEGEEIVVLVPDNS